MRTPIAASIIAISVAAVLAVAMLATGTNTGTADATDATSTAGSTRTVVSTSTAGTTRTVVASATTGVTQTPQATRTVGVTQTPPVTRTVDPTATTPAGSDGCTPGYWKVPVHHDSWAATGYTTGQTLESVFDVPDAYGVDNVSLVAAMSFGGGPTTTDAAKLLLHHAVAGLLNASHPDVDYAVSAADLIADVNAALATNNRATMLALKSEIDADNNAGCTLN